MKLRKNLILLGAGGHALSVAGAALSAGWNVVGFLAPDAPCGHLLPGRRYESFKEIDRSSHNLALAVGDNTVRQEIFLGAQQEVEGIEFATIIHSSAFVSTTAELGVGAVIMSQANVGPHCSIGIGALVNSAASLDHESTLGDFASLGPGAITGGNVNLGSLSQIGIGANILPGVSIGAKAVIGAGSIVNKEIGANSIAYGNPCRVRGNL